MAENILVASCLTLPRLLDTVAVTKTWFLCRAAADKDKAVRSGTVSCEKEDDALDSQTIRYTS